MSRHYLRRHLTPAVLAEQQNAYGQSYSVPDATGPDVLGDQERQFVAARDSFYIASLTEDGAPYLQHRGGPVGFLKVVDGGTLEFPDYAGNRQLLTRAHVRRDPRVALFLMDYPNRRRLKIDGVAEVVMAEQVKGTQDQPVERLVRIRLQAYDWNCPQYITPRYTEEEVEGLIESRHQLLLQRVAELEAQLDQLERKGA